FVERTVEYFRFMRNADYVDIGCADACQCRLLEGFVKGIFATNFDNAACLRNAATLGNRKAQLVPIFLERNDGIVLAAAALVGQNASPPPDQTSCCSQVAGGPQERRLEVILQAQEMLWS